MTTWSGQTPRVDMGNGDASTPSDGARHNHDLAMAMIPAHGNSLLSEESLWSRALFYTSPTVEFFKYITSRHLQHRNIYLKSRMNPPHQRAAFNFLNALNLWIQKDFIDVDEQHTTMNTIAFLQKFDSDRFAATTLITIKSP
ncbi:hypothetical protein FHR20_000969 [Sphingomonas leidyi]|uniref:Uncharacterized protein n=1 Tax=Sphingomonas leidyi TaxID=68569 RepID=A0A7X5UXK9_9SPHN|nr:hypothetical protein [Sphingomonas leidyi]NIJ64038.1 hypothetical protein [Sphingomonas leidyi]